MDIWLCNVTALVVLKSNKGYERSGNIESLVKKDYYYKIIKDIPVLYDCDMPYLDGVYGRNVMRHFGGKVHKLVKFERLKKIGESVW
jgi:hypothetical protein